jgi:lipid-binding SYLF domain-containing protein
MMKSRLVYGLIALNLVATGHAGALFDKITEGAGKAAEAVGDATQSAVDTTSDLVKKGADKVDQTIESTKESLGDEATPAATRAKLDDMAARTLERLFAEKPQSRELFDQSSGYAVFDAREASFYVVAGYGRGVAVNRQSDSRVYMKMATGGAGLSFGIGGWESQMVILFENASDFNEFVEQGLDATAEAGTMVGEEKDELGYRFNGGKSVFVLTRKGWKISAKLTGSRYWPDDELN